MHRAVLYLWGLILACGLGFYLGRATEKHKAAAGESSQVTTAAPPLQTPKPVAGGRQVEPPVAPNESSAEEGQQTRSRSIEAGPVAARRLGVPVHGINPAEIRDGFYDTRGGSRMHGATDIMAPRGTPVLAVDDGTVKKLFLSKAGGNTIYQFDPSQQYCYYYAHLDRYAEGLQEGMTVRRGQVIAYVGSTGDADANAPHLHFEVHELGPDREWWKGTAVDPYPLLMRAYGR